jgi:hypothetical protein
MLENQDAEDQDAEKDAENRDKNAEATRTRI